MAEVQVAAEDGFALLRVAANEDLAPHIFTMGNLGLSVEQLALPWQAVWDLRSTRGPIYSDVADALGEALSYGTPTRPCSILVPPGRAAELRASLWAPVMRSHGNGVVIRKMRDKPIVRKALDLGIFDEDVVVDPPLDL